MCSVVLKAIATIALILPTLTSAHQMSPGFETEIAANGVLYKEYKLTNTYGHPAVFEVEIFNKDFSHKCRN